MALYVTSARDIPDDPVETMIVSTQGYNDDG